MTAVEQPVVAWHGEIDLRSPLVVLLHGRGSNEMDIIALADHLPPGLAYAAVQAPIAEGGGYAWFANRGIGRPVTDSLRETMDGFRAWLDRAAPVGPPVVLVGFSGGAAFAGGLILDDPQRYAGAAALYGTLPFEAGGADHRWEPCRAAGARGPGRHRHRHPARASRPHLELPQRRRGQHDDTRARPRRTRHQCSAVLQARRSLADRTHDLRSEADMMAEIVDKIRWERELLDPDRLLARIRLGGRPVAATARSIELLATEMLPVVRCATAAAKRTPERITS